MKSLVLAGAIAIASIALAGCVTDGNNSVIPGAPVVTVDPHTAGKAVADFNAAEDAAAIYFRLPVCGKPPCHTKADAAKVAKAMRKAREARNYVVAQLHASHGGPIAVTSWNALQQELALVQSIVGSWR